MRQTKKGTMQTENQMQKWLDGQISLGAAANWETSEIRIISEIAYTLAQQGRAREAVVLFEGLVALAPATAYFQAALGALFLRLKNLPRAIEHLDAALAIEPNDTSSLVNRGEAKLRGGNAAEARADFERAVRVGAQNFSNQSEVNDESALSIARARALLKVAA